MGNDTSRALGDGPPMTPYASGVLASPRSPSTGLRRTRSLSGAMVTNHNDPSTPQQPPSLNGNAKMDKTIQRMDKTIRKRVRGGITYNMKIIIRGEKGTGKTSLFHRLKGEPIPSIHAPTPQLQSATINWSYRANSEESVKCEVWDVVDRGFHVHEGETNPFESPEPTTATNGPHVMGVVDASTVDVYHETHGVVFLLDVTKPHTLEYVRQQLDKVPVHIPTLVLGNFRDCGQQRKIFKEDIQTLLYGASMSAGGGGGRNPVGFRRPQELLYFECSLLNCYGLKSLHQYFGIPFLQLKLQTLRQQMRILDGEFSHLKHDLQAKIAEQRYTDYVEHIKATGSDIRTGRRVAVPSPQPTVTSATTASQASSATAMTTDDRLSHESGGMMDAGASPTSSIARIERTQSSSSDVMVGDAKKTGQDDDTNEMPPLPTPSVMIQDLEDLPERSKVTDNVGLKIAYTDADQPQKTLKKAPSSMEDDEEQRTSTKEKTTTKTAKRVAENRNPESHDATASPLTVPMNLEDFQVPKSRISDLDNFYSDDESSEEEDDNDDVVVAPGSVGGGLMRSTSAAYHKQQFLDSDSEEEEAQLTSRSQHSTHANATKGAATTPPAASTKSQRSPRRHGTKRKDDVESPAPATPSPVLAATPMPPLPMPGLSNGKIPVSPPRSPNQRQSPRRLMQEKKSGNESESGNTSTVSEARDVESKSEVNTEDNVQPASVVVEDSVSHGTNPVVKDEVREASVEESGPHDPTHVDDEVGRDEDRVVVVESPADSVFPPDESSVSDIKEDNGQIATHELPITKKDHTEDDDDGALDGLAANIGDFLSDDDDDQRVCDRESTVAQDLNYRDEDLPPPRDEAASVPTRSIDTPTKRPDMVHSDDDDDDDDEEQSTPFVSVPRVVTSVSPLKRTDMVHSDEDDKKERLAPVVRVPTAVSKHQDMVHSEDENDEGERLPVTVLASLATPIPLAKRVDIYHSDDDDVDEEEQVHSAPGLHGSSVLTPVNRSDLVYSDDEDEDASVVEAKSELPVSRPHVPVNQRPITGEPEPESRSSGSSSSREDRPSSKPNMRPSSKPNMRRPEVLVSDNEDEDDEPPIVQHMQRPQPQSDDDDEPVITPLTNTVVPSPPFFPSSKNGKSGNELESFLNDSDDDDDASAFSLSSSKPKPVSAHAFALDTDDDDDDDQDDDRFAAYDAKKTRRNKTQRRQERDEIKRMSVQSTIIDSSPPPATASPVVSADVLAAIRQAQADAMRMLDGVRTEGQSALVSATDVDVVKKKKKSNKSKKTEGDGADDGMKKSKKSSSKKSKTKRREIILTDEE